jgi:4-amino-4-deoxy-L-arabinose transferase-like glycosyltransferase
VSVLLWGLVVGIRDRFPLRLAVAIGIALGLGLLAKGTTVAIVPVIAVAVLVAVGWRDWRGLVSRGVGIGLPAVVLAAPWYVFLYRTYGDLGGLGRVAELQYWNAPMGSFGELLIDPEFILGRFRETWGEFGWRLIHLGTPLLWAIAIPTLLGLAGLVVFAIASWRGFSLWGVAGERLAPWQWWALGTLALTALLAYLAVIQFGTSFALSQARYFFPVVNAAALLVMVGWRTLLPPPARPAGQGIFVGTLLLLNIIIMTAYVLPFTITVDEPVITWRWGG